MASKSKVVFEDTDTINVGWPFVKGIVYQQNNKAFIHLVITVFNVYRTDIDPLSPFHSIDNYLSAEVGLRLNDFIRGLGYETNYIGSRSMIEVSSADIGAICSAVALTGFTTEMATISADLELVVI